MTIQVNLFDVLAVAFLFYLAFTESLWWIIPAVIFVLSWAFVPRWERKNGWRFLR